MICAFVSAGAAGLEQRFGHLGVSRERGRGLSGLNALTGWLNAQWRPALA